MTGPEPPPPPPLPAEPSGSRAVVCRVPGAAAGERLDVYLARQAEVGSRRVAKELIKAGGVTVDGRRVKAGQALRVGQRVAFEPIPAPAATAAIEEGAGPQPRVLHEDRCILVVEKPAGLVSHPALHGRNQESVASFATGHCAETLPLIAGDDRPGIVHRLDRETSGVMVLAKTEDAFHFLKGEFKARRVHKEYRAIVYGEARFDSDYIERNIATHPKKGDRMIVVREGGREAITYYEVVTRFKGFTYFACRPRTGRTHQIRVHLTSIGHGLVGDRFYRSRNHSNATLPAGAPDPGRHCLHAQRLSFTHPHSREEIAFEVPLPRDMQELLAWLQENRG